MRVDADQSRGTSGTGSPPGMPRWVKVFGIIGIGMLVLVIIALVTGHGGPGLHGPRRHVPPGDPTPSTNQTTSDTPTSPVAQAPKTGGGPEADSGSGTAPSPRLAASPSPGSPLVDAGGP